MEKAVGEGKKKKKSRVRKSVPAVYMLLHNEVVRFVLGVVFSLLAVFTLVSIVSYLFTWGRDVGFFYARLLVSRWFGLGAFIIPFFFAGLAVYCFRKRGIRLMRLFVLSLTGCIVLSVLFSYIFSFTPARTMFGDGAGGSYGYYINEWLVSMTGEFGAACIILFFLILWAVMLNTRIVGRITAFFDSLIARHEARRAAAAAAREEEAARSGSADETESVGDGETEEEDGTRDEESVEEEEAVPEQDAEGFLDGGIELDADADSGGGTGDEPGFEVIPSVPQDPEPVQAADAEAAGAGGDEGAPGRRFLHPGLFQHLLYGQGESGSVHRPAHHQPAQKEGKSMTLELQIWMLLGAAAYLLLIFWMLKTHRLNVRYSLVWLLFGLALVLFAAVPYVVFVLRDIFDIQMPSNLVFAMVIGFVLLISLSISAAITDFAERIKRLTQTVAILEKRVRQLESQLDQARSDEDEPR